MKKFCKNYLYYHFVADILAVVVFILAFSDALIIENEMEEFVGIRTAAIPWFVLAALAVYGVLILYRVLYLRTAGYMLTEGEIRVTRGVLFRKNSILEYKKMHAINKKQNIIQKLFGLAVLTVDSGSANTSGTAEILIYETEKEVDALLAVLKARKNGEVPAQEESEAPVDEVLTAKGGDLVFSSGKKMIYSLLNIVSAAFSMLVVCFFALVVYVCLIPLLYDLLAGGAFFVLVPALVIALIVLVGISVFTFIVSILQSFIGYYNFRIAKHGTDLEISYGLLTRHTNTFGYNRIQGVVVQQGLIQRIFGYATLRLEVIGYHEGGDEQNNSGSMIGMLLPLCHIREVESILEGILPAYVPEKKQTAAKRYFPFVSWSSLLIGAITALVALLTLSMMHLFSAPARALAIVRLLILLAFAITMAVHLFGAYLSYKNAGIAISEDCITVYGGGYQKRITTILRRSLIAVEDVTTPMRAKNGIYTLILHIRTNAETNEIKVGMLDLASAQKLKDLLPV